MNTTEKAPRSRGTKHPEIDVAMAKSMPYACDWVPRHMREALAPVSFGATETTHLHCNGEHYVADRNAAFYAGGVEVADEIRASKTLDVARVFAPADPAASPDVPLERGTWFLLPPYYAADASLVHVHRFATPLGTARRIRSYVATTYLDAVDKLFPAAEKNGARWWGRSPRTNGMLVMLVEPSGGRVLAAIMETLVRRSDW